MSVRKVLHKGLEYVTGAVDIGNSRTKIIISEKYFAFEHEDTSDTKLISFLESQKADRLLLAYSSVNKHALSRLEEITGELENIELTDITPYIKSQGFIDFNNISGIGADRVLGLLGAATEFTPPLITVDCGTAITVNALDKDYVCRGGAIFAGIYTQVRALAEHADGLELTELGPVEKAAGKNTPGALNSGIVLGAAGAVRQICERIIDEEFAGSAAKIIFTGGYPDLIRPELETAGWNTITSKNLVLKGILSLIPG